jgi:hypothetical protein
MQLVEQSARDVKKLLGLRRVAAFGPQPFNASAKLNNSIFRVCNPLGNLQEIRWDAPHTVYPQLNQGQKLLA